MGIVDYGQTYKALLNSPDECGDVGLIEFDDECFLAALIDGLGHGVYARQAALLAKEYIHENISAPLNILISGMHEHIKGTRGAVAAIIRIDLESGCLLYSGIGNISAKLLKNEIIKLVPKDGVVGYIMSTPVQKEYKISKGEILILHSDGIKGHFSEDNIRKWKDTPAQQIAEDILRDYSVTGDDASCIVLKYS